MKGGITKIRDDVTTRLTEMVGKVGNMQGFLNRVIYQEYRLIQINRWDTENRSEGSQWPSINRLYASYKLHRFAQYPYAGAKMGVATGTLLQGAVGPSSNHRKIATKSSLVVSTTVPYATHFDADRSINTYSKKTMDRLRGMVKDYVKG